MSLLFSIPELKTIRLAYQTMGISDSDVLRKVQEIIRLSHFSPDDIEEIAEEMEIFSKLTEDSKLKDFGTLIVGKAQQIGRIQEIAMRRKTA